MWKYVVVGSHDSMSYTISPESAAAPDLDVIIQRAMKYIGFIIQPIVYTWCITQSCTVLEQLALGIRYFDVRIATKRQTNDLFFVHGLYGDRVNGAFEDMAKYLMDHPTEIIILDMQHFYKFSKNDHQHCIDLLKNIFGKMLCPFPKNALSVSLDWMQRNRYQVIVIYRNKCGESAEEMWMSCSWPTPWPQTMSTTKLVRFLEASLQSRPADCGFVSQCVLTPTNTTVIKSPFSSVKYKCAIPACRTTLPWIKHHHQPPINVAISDFVQIENALFPNTVIALNYM